MKIDNLCRIDIYLVFCVIITLLAAGGASSQDKCDKTCLRQFTQGYIDALVKNDHKGLPVAENLKYTENGQEIKPGEGLWKSARSIGEYRFFIEDPETSQASFIGIVEEAAGPAILWLRLKIARRQISEIETIVTRKGSHAIFAPEGFKTPYPLFTEAIAPDKRESRDRLIAVTNTYFDGIEAHDSKIVLADPDCDRIENGMKTTHRNTIGSQMESCATSADLLTYIKGVDNRRFPIVDIEHGVVMAVITFDIPAGPPPIPAQASVADKELMSKLRNTPRTLLLAEVFKIENGRIQHIEAFMHNLPYGSSPGW
jgi:hypothetical protein